MQVSQVADLITHAVVEHTSVSAKISQDASSLLALIPSIQQKLAVIRDCYNAWIRISKPLHRQASITLP